MSTTPLWFVFWFIVVFVTFWGIGEALYYRVRLKRWEKDLD